MDFIFDPSLVLYLPLYELDSASFMSKDAYGHLCTVTDAVWRFNGRYFDGTGDLITVPDHSALNITGNITVEVWANWSQLRDNAVPLGKLTTGSAGYMFYGGGIGSLLFFCYGLSTVNVATSLTIAVDRWYHLVGMYDGATLSIFVNLTKDSDASTGSIAASSNDLKLARYGGTANYFKGLIGEVRIYNRALSPSEVQHNYLATKWRYR